MTPRGYLLPVYLHVQLELDGKAGWARFLRTRQPEERVSCAHVGVPAGPPWCQTVSGPRCSKCGRPWPGHELPNSPNPREKARPYGEVRDDD